MLGIQLAGSKVVVVINDILATPAKPMFERLISALKTKIEAEVSTAYAVQQIYFAINKSYADSLSKLGYIWK